MDAFWKTEEESKASSAPSSEVTPAACCSAVFIIQSHLSFGAFCQPSRRCLETTGSAVSSLCTLQELRCSCEAGRQESTILKWQLQVSREDVRGEVALWGGGRGLCICQVWSTAGSAEALAAALGQVPAWKEEPWEGPRKDVHQTHPGPAAASLKRE